MNCFAYEYWRCLSHSCVICGETHSALIPQLQDFEAAEVDAESGRLKSLSRYSDSFHLFQNFRGDCFLRTLIDVEPVEWYFKPEKCKFISICPATADQLETCYEPFLRFHSNECRELLFKGYHIEKKVDGSVIAYFSKSLYSSNTLEYQAEVPPIQIEMSPSGISLTGNEIESLRLDDGTEYELNDQTTDGPPFQQYPPNAFYIPKYIQQPGSNQTPLPKWDTYPYSAKENPQYMNTNFRKNLIYAPQSTEVCPVDLNQNLAFVPEYNGQSTYAPNGKFNNNLYYDYTRFNDRPYIDAHHKSGSYFRGSYKKDYIKKFDYRHAIEYMRKENQLEAPGEKSKLRSRNFSPQEEDFVVILGSEDQLRLERETSNIPTTRELTKKDKCLHVSPQEDDFLIILGSEDHLKQQRETSNIPTTRKLTKKDKSLHVKFGFRNSEGYFRNGESSGEKNKVPRRYFSGQKEEFSKLTSGEEHLKRRDKFSRIQTEYDPTLISEKSTSGSNKVHHEAFPLPRLRLKEDGILADSGVHALGSHDLFEAECLPLDPDGFMGSSSDDLAQESMLPLNADKRLEVQEKQKGYRPRKIDKTPRYIPVTSDKQSFLDSRKMMTKDACAGHQASNIEVFSHLQNALRDCYLKHSWTEKFPFLYPFHRLSKSTLFYFTLKEGGQNCTDSQDMLSILCSGPKKEMLIVGSPGFGKTTLCYMIAHGWASGFRRETELCIRCFLPEVIENHPDLPEAIVFYCRVVLGGKVSDLELIRNTLSKYSKKILLLLDGYDQVPEDRRKDVINFLKHRTIFRESAILVTSGPSADKALVGMFGTQAVIKGFSEFLLRNFMVTVDLPEVTITSFMDTIQAKKLVYLSELSPLFTLFVAKTISDSAADLSVFNSLYSFLKIVIISMISWKISKSVDLVDCVELLQVFGKKCFEQLLLGQHDFEEVSLKEVFGSYFNVLLDCNIFYFASGTNNARKYRTSGHVLQVFFATMYLRKLWSGTENHRRFLEESFCRNSCSGDLVSNASDKGASYVYYVGLIPEIVLKFGKDQSMQNASFEMYYDVDRVEHSRAFDSVNLLLRVSDQFLSRYSFSKRHDGDRNISVLENRFGDVLNLIPTEDFTVQHDFYANKHEEKDFLKIVLREGEETEAALYEVVRANKEGTFDRINVNFAYGKLEGIFAFVSAQLSLYLNQFSINQNLKHGSMEDLVYELVSQLLECTNFRTATVGCKGVEEPSKINLTFYISNQHDQNFSKVVLSSSGIVSDKFWFDRKVYQKSDFSKNMTDVKTLIRDCELVSKSSKILIDVSLQ